MSEKRRALALLERLRELYPNPKSALNWGSAWELLVATVLAAQCTDARVNTVTPEFFRRWPTVEALAAADSLAIEPVVHSTGFFRQKAKHLAATARLLVEQHAGQVPQTMEELLKLPGVARKTANIILSNAFGQNEGIAVDTHVRRIAFRLGFTLARDPRVIEKDLMPLFPQIDWGLLNHCLVLFGREVCTARAPACATCPMADLCPKAGMRG